ncbi:MAG TPA: HAMP domain-containing sensor histidine kinase [Gaiellaceae bacterium]
MHDLRQAVRGFRTGSLFLAAGLILCVVYFLVPRGNAQSVIYDLIGVGSSVAIAAGVYLNKPDYRLPWFLFAIGNLFFAVADIIFNIIVNPPVPSVADWFYLAGYPILTCGLVLLVVRAGGHHRLAAIDEAAIVTIAFALFQWVWIMDAINDGPGSVTERAVNLAYPAMDVLLLAGLAGFFVTAAWRTPAFVMLVLSLTALLVSDDIYGAQRDAYRSGDYTDLGWLLSYILWAAAALHPSMRELSKPRRRRVRLRIHPVRVVLLTVALLSAPAVLLIQHIRKIPFDPYAIVLAGAGIAILVVARLVGILRALERIREREQSARADAEHAQMLLALQNEQLLEADKLKDEFVALISHDLRTPLTSIIGYVELALEDVGDPLDDERRAYLEVVSRSSDRLLRLVDDLLFVARVQAGRLVLERSHLDLCTIARQSVEEARPRAENKQLTIAFNGNGAVMLEADKGRLFQLLDNLISNAIKFTPEGGRVDVTVEPVSDGAVLEVIDTGMGLGPGEAEFVFDRFFRSSRVVAQQVPGTGLGLFISRAIVEAHGGTIAVAGRDGGGTTFRIQLPLRVPRAQTTAELVA